MWGKPKELTAGWGTRCFTGNGYEIAAGWPGNADEVVTMWKEIGDAARPHNDVMVNLDIWKDKKWASLGAGLYKGYCCAWFSDEEDPGTAA